MYKIIMLSMILIVLFFVGCASNHPSFKYSSQDEVANIQISKDKVYQYKLQNVKFQNKLEMCVQDGYTIKTKFSDTELFIEHIALDVTCVWNGLAHGMYIDFLEDKIKSGRMKLIEQIDIQKYEFSVYKTDKDCILYLIVIYNGTDTTFIVDKNGTFYNDLLSKLDPTIKSKNSEAKCTVTFSSSLLDNNIFGNYFENLSKRF